MAPSQPKRKITRRKLVAAGGKAHQMRAECPNAFTKARQRAFLEALAETCNVMQACRESGVSATAAYNKRKKDAAFRAAWREAIAVSYQRLEMVLLERAFLGNEKLVIRKDGSEERMREFSNSLGLTLLKMHRETAMESETEHSPADISEIRERLIRKLDRLRQRNETNATGE